MKIAKALGLTDEEFCKMMCEVKMFGMVNVLGHSAELLYEKWLKSQGIKFDKADNDEHFDYTRKNDKKRVQVKRFETAGTTLEQLSVNLTKTHGNRSGSGTGSNYFPKNF